MKSYDLIIVGAGPAGSTLARLAGTERSVLLLDGQFRNKPCGGLLAPDAQKALARFGLTLPKDVLVDPQIFSVKTIDVPTGLIRWYPRTYLNVDRRRFDAWLLDLAVEHSDVISARLRRVEKVGEMYCVRFSAPGGEMQTACAPVIVGADGAGSLVRRSLFPALRTRTYVSVQQWFREDSSRVNPFYSCIFDPQATDCCAWSIHKDGQMLFGGAYRPHGCRKAFEGQKQRLARFGFDRDLFALHDHGGKALFVLMRVFLSNFNIRAISRNAFFLFGNFFRKILEQLILQHIPLRQVGRLLQFQFCDIRVKLHLLHNLRISACKGFDLRIRQRRIVHIFGAAHGRL